MIIRIVFLAAVLIFVSCGSEEKRSLPPQGDSTQAMRVTAANCNELEKEVADLKEEIAGLKKQLKKNNSSTQQSSTSKPSIKPEVGKRDSDGSIRCSMLTNGERCMRRTFSRNGLCAKHGGDEAVGK